MAQLAQLLKLDPPRHFPPPPKSVDRFDDGTAATVSAESQRYTATSSPTQAQSRLTDKEVKAVYLLRYFLTLDWSEHDVRAVYPRSYLQEHGEVVLLRNKASRLRGNIGNSFMSITGSASSYRWFSRVVNGFVSVHDYDAHMFNLQRDVLAANIASPNENEVVRETRLERLAALKESFVEHKDAMIKKINLAEKFAPAYLEEKDSNETYSDLEHPPYLETPNIICKQYQNMHLWDPVQTLLEIPSHMPTYIEKYGSKSAGLRNFHDFWSQVWCLPGYAKSFYSDFKDVIYLPAALDYDTHPEGAKHMQTIFQLAAHYAWTTASSPPLVFFDTLRALIAGRSPRLQFRDIPVRDPDNDEEGLAMRKSKRRKLKN